MPDTTLAARLRTLREARGLRASDLARQSGISRQLYAKYESGEVLPRWDVILRLADALQVDLEQLRSSPKGR